MAEHELAALLSSSPEEGARRIGLRWLDSASEAAGRLLAGDDAEALHDLRVALRRLRSVLRLHRNELRGAVRRKHRRRLRALVASTGEARDVEVQYAWLRDAAATLPGDTRPGVEWLLERLRQTQDGAYLRVRTETMPALLELLPRIRRGLERYVVERLVGYAAPERRYADVLAAALRAQMEELRSSLHRVRAIDDDAMAHQARIHGKRLRYLIEPLRDERSDAQKVVHILRELQDLLGGLQDVAVRIGMIRGHLEKAAIARARQITEPAGAAPGSEGDDAIPDPEVERALLALLRVCHERKRETFCALQRAWLDDRGPLDALSAGVEALAGALEAEHRGALDSMREIERKYLLDAVPAHARKHPKFEIDQGWVPGERLHERLRRVRGGGEERYYRCVKLGEGLRRIEIEEPTTRAIFARLWPLTKGKRVRKRRYVVEENGARWEIDEFRDRDLVLAEIELDSEDAEVRIPAWLAPHVVREVTGEPEYVNLNLAR
jgi:CHAD domain-containing protein/CYTH domain-containing protein